MKIFYSILDFKLFLNSFSKNSIGFVPTMGSIHRAHILLIEKSKQQNDLTICSIFINPTQFNKKEDWINYPRSIKKDLSLLKSVNCDICFLPSIRDIYPNGFSKIPFMSFSSLDKTMEGIFRVGHFQGVATVLYRFLNIISPSIAYFGEKDFQQLRIVQYMRDKLNIPTKIIGLPIIRENNGLAMSSRNIRLNTFERKYASIIYKTLINVRKLFLKKKFYNINSYVRDSFSKKFFYLEYFSICDEESLIEIDFFNPLKRYRAFISIFIRNIRLIDNIPLY